MNKRVYLLLCDVNIAVGGHYISHNQFILNNFERIEKENPRLHISFLYNAEAKELLDYKRHSERVSFLDSIQETNDAKRRYVIVKKLKTFTQSHKVDHLVFMDFDKYQLPFFLFKFNCSISGILFRPHHRIKASNKSFKNKIASKITRYKKIIAEKLLVYNQSIENIYILNDTEGVTFLNKLHKSNYFKYLPDPIYKYGYDKQNIRLNGFSHNSYKYLIFGALDERKNITNVLTAYNAASLTFKSEILLVGPVQQPYLDYLNELIRGLKTIDNDHKKVFIRGEFVTNEEMEYYFSVSDVCLLTYKDFFGSSGLLGRAALHKKKVIGSNVGVISSLIDQYKLGITCDPHSIESISSGLSSVKSFTPDPGLFKSYYEKHSPEVFLKTLLKVESE